MAAVNKKNGLIELFRFLCSIWVAYFHGFFPISSDKFNGVILPVDFFFIVTGFFFLQSIEKYKETPYWQGVRDIIWSRIKRFIVPLIIAFMSICLCNILFPMDMGFNWPLSFLWFFAAQFLLLALFYLLSKKIKSKTIYNVICIAVVATFLFLSKISGRPMDIPFRSPAMMAVGILLSQIPKIDIKLKSEKGTRNLNLLINVVGFLIAAATFIYLAYLPENAIWKIHFLCCLICPAVVYFATSIPVHSKFLNFLGEFSVFIYLAQCPILFHHYAVSENAQDQFIWLCVCAVAMFVLNRIINAKLNKAKPIKN